MSSSAYKIIEYTLTAAGITEPLRRYKSGISGHGNATVYIAGNKVYAVSKLPPALPFKWVRHEIQRFSYNKPLWVAEL